MQGRVGGLGAEIAGWWERATWWVGGWVGGWGTETAWLVWCRGRAPHLQQQCLHGRHSAGAAGQAQEASRQRGAGSAMAAG